MLNLPLCAQEIGVSFLKTWSDDYQLKNPKGYGIHLYFPIKRIAIKAEYNYASGEETYQGRISPGFLVLPEDIPIEENINTKSIIKSYDISLWFQDLISQLNPLKLNLGAGVSLNDLEGSRKGLTSGKEIGFRSSNRVGYMLSFSLSYPKIMNLPLRLEVLYKLKILPSSGAMATDSENVFADAIGIKQLSLGLSYIFN